VPNDRRAGVDELLVSPVELCLWRAPTDNDGFKLFPDLAQRLRVGGDALWRWLAAGLHERPADELVTHAVTRHVDDAGIAEHRHQVAVPESLPDLPRVGVTFSLGPGFTRMRWFGRGPHENYPDRHQAATFGVWEAPLDEPPYLVPQEFGLRTDCRWFELIDPVARRAVRVDVLVPSALHCSATRYRASDLFAAATATDLPPRDEVVVHLDVAHRGLGTASCGPDVLPRYRLQPGRYQFAYRLTARTG
jgi:beta-galactosidase